MARQIKIEFVKTYATEANAVKAVEKKFGSDNDGLRYIIVPQPDGRFAPLFIGNSAIEHQVFFHFNVMN